MSSAWKLVEAVADEAPGQKQKILSSSENSEQHNRSQHGGRGGRGSGRHGRGRGRGSKRPRMTQQDRNYVAHMAMQQIELIFGPDNLCMDTFVRSYMDEAGYVPFMLIMNYQNVAYFGAHYYDTMNLIQQTPTSKLEVDLQNETIRLKEGWDKYLMPNGYGGRGLPRYVKQQNAEGSGYQNFSYDGSQQYGEYAYDGSYEGSYYGEAEVEGSGEYAQYDQAEQDVAQEQQQQSI